MDQTKPTCSPDCKFCEAIKEGRARERRYPLPRGSRGGLALAVVSAALCLLLATRDGWPETADTIAVLLSVIAINTAVLGALLWMVGGAQGSGR